MQWEGEILNTLKVARAGALCVAVLTSTAIPVSAQEVPFPNQPLPRELLTDVAGTEDPVPWDEITVPGCTEGDLAAEAECDSASSFVYYSTSGSPNLAKNTWRLSSSSATILGGNALALSDSYPAYNNIMWIRTMTGSTIRATANGLHEVSMSHAAYAGATSRCKWTKQDDNFNGAGSGSSIPVRCRYTRA
jgi:hypothetical protein